jgi:hypothetical protein
MDDARIAAAKNRVPIFEFAGRTTAAFQNVLSSRIVTDRVAYDHDKREELSHA